MILLPFFMEKTAILFIWNRHIGRETVEKPQRPDNEPERLQCLLSMSVLDTRPEERFDRLTRIAQSIFGVPIVLISLVDTERQWFKSKQGTNLRETPRDISFCGHAILQNDIFFVPDALRDARFFDNPLVIGPPNIRFYAGLPLSGQNGLKVGTLCIIDTKPRELTDEDISALRDIADCVEDELMLTNEKLIETKLHMIINHVSDGVIMMNDKLQIESINKSAQLLFGYSEDMMIGRDFKSLIADPKHHEWDECLRCSKNNQEEDSYCELIGLRCDKSPFSVSCTVLSAPDGTSYVVVIKPLING